MSFINFFLSNVGFGRVKKIKRLREAFLLSTQNICYFKADHEYVPFSESRSTDLEIRSSIFGGCTELRPMGK